MDYLEQTEDFGALRAADGPAIPMRDFGSDHGLIASAPPADAPMQADPGRPWLIKYGKHLRGAFDRLIAACSLVPNDPVLDAKDFAWTTALSEHWQAIRDEAVAAALDRRPAPSLASISPDHRAIAPMNKWRSFFLWGYGYACEENVARCPATSKVVSEIPGMVSAFYSILAPGTHIPAHRGVTKGLMTCHLGLIVPADGDVRMRVDDHIVRWTEGEVLLFDDTYDHEVWNDTSGTRVVLLIHVRRPVRQPGKWFVDKFMEVIRRSAFVQEARSNIDQWNATMKAMDG